MAPQREFTSNLPSNLYRRLMIAIKHVMDRCTNPADPHWQYYGGRGIYVCAEWLVNRQAFFDHLLTLPGWDDFSLWLDRADNSKGYEPGNLRFVTPAESRLNQRSVEAFIPEANAEYGYWTVREPARIQSLCECRCGRLKLVQNKHLRGGASTKCLSCATSERNKRQVVERKLANLSS